MEAYTNTQTTLVLDISGNSNPSVEADALPTVTISDVYSVVETGLATDELGGVYSYVFPMYLSQEESRYKVEWEFSINSRQFSRIEYVDVVTPYATLDQLRDFDVSLATLPDSKLVELEKIARYTINSITGQKFSRWSGQVTVNGMNADTLTVPNRIISLDSVNYLWGNIGDLQDVGVYVIDEYTLGYAPWAYSSDWNFSYTSSGVIFAPPLGDNFFFNDAQAYIIQGEFGWESVPDDISLAAMMLVRDYACSDDIYRRKGVTDFNDGTSSVKFGGLTDTGNVDVDRILDSYASPGWAVV